MITKNIEKPSILVIDDDEPEELDTKIAAGLDNRATSYVIHPQDVKLSDLNNADLVLVDYRLENWPERDGLLINDLPIISLSPTNGIALAVMLRERVDKFKKDKLTAFALHTGHIEDIQGRLPLATTQHVRAQLNNLEWVFMKNEPHRYDQMLLLADAVRQLPAQWPEDSDGSASMVQKFLNIDENSVSFERCWRDVKDCRVPVEELFMGGHSILFIRWLLHQILPYPCFLWAEHWVAARLGISIEALREVLKGDSNMAKDLNSMRYSGILAGFLGDRWWRGALEDYVWNLSGEYMGDVQQLRDALAKRAGMDLDSINANPAVVCVDKNWQPDDEFLSPMTAITLHPDHWPSFADSAYMDIKIVLDDPILRSIVDPLEQHRIEGDKE